MKLLKDSAIYLLGELFAKIIPFLMLPYLSHKLGVAGFGELSYYQTYLALCVLVLGLCQDGAVARYFYFYGKRSLNLVVKAGYGYTLAMGGVSLLLCYLYQSAILAYIVLAAMFQSLIGVQLSIQQCQKKAITYTTIQVLSGLCSSLLTILLLEMFYQELVQKRFLALALANVLVFVGAYVFYQKHITNPKKFYYHHYKAALCYIAAFGLPLILHHLSLFARGQLDRIFIYHQFGEADLGRYAMGATVASALSVAIMAVNKALLPYYYEALKQQKLTLKHIHQWSLYALVLVPIPALVLWLIPESWMVWIFGQDFLGVKYYIVLFVVSVALSVPYLMMVNYLFYYGKNTWISLCSVITTLIYLLALVLLLQTSIIYLPYASIIGALVILPILYVMTKRVVTTS